MKGGLCLDLVDGAALNDLALGNLIDTGQTGRPDFKRAPAALLLLPRRQPFPLFPLPRFRVLFKWSDVGWKSVSRGGQREDDEVEEAAAIPSTRE